jgi:hypothetical protein
MVQLKGGDWVLRAASGLERGGDVLEGCQMGKGWTRVRVDFVRAGVTIPR